MLNVLLIVLTLHVTCYCGQ